MNNAGTAIPKTFEETTLEELDRVIDVNVRGTFVATQAALKHMKNGGRIIMIGSCVGERVMTPGLVPYSATKGAVKMFTQGLSREVGSRGITVNNIQPGPIDTELNPAAGDWAVPQKANTALNRYGSCRRGRRLGRVRRRSGGVVHHRREPDRRRRHQRLTASLIDDEAGTAISARGFCRTGKAASNARSAGMINTQYISSGGRCPMANVVTYAGHHLH